VDEQPFEHGLDVTRPAELAHETRTPATLSDDHQIAGTDIAAPFAVNRDGNVRDEERLADELLAALVDLDDEEVAQTRRKRRMVKPDPAAPSRRPVAIRINAFSENERAFTSLPAFSGPV
jgi:hypothetical protein